VCPAPDAFPDPPVKAASLSEAAPPLDTARRPGEAPPREPFGFVAVTFAVVTWLLLVTAAAASPLFW